MRCEFCCNYVALHFVPTDLGREAHLCNRCCRKHGRPTPFSIREGSFWGRFAQPEKRARPSRRRAPMQRRFPFMYSNDS